MNSHPITLPEEQIAEASERRRRRTFRRTVAAFVSCVVQANAEVFRLLHQARLLEGVDWKVRFTSPLFSLMFPQLPSHRQLAKFGTAAVYVQFRDGDHAEAIETVRDIRRLARAVSATPRTTLMGHQVANACHAVAIFPLETFTHELAVSDAEPAPSRPAGGKSPATRTQVHTLIRELLDDSASRKGFRNAMNGERASHLDAFQSLLAVNVGVGGPAAGGTPNVMTTWIRPVFELDAVFMLGQMSNYADAASAPNWPAANEMFAECAAEQERLYSQEDSLRGLTHRLSRILSISFRPVFFHFRLIATRRMTAVALAIRLYELDRGRRPERLADLVPDYLAALPDDPFADDGRCLGYKPNAERPVLYSVGRDGRDDDGQYVTRRSGGVDWDLKDLVYFMNGDRPRGPVQPPEGVPASGQAVEDYSEEGADQGDSDRIEEDGDQSVSTVSDSVNYHLAIR